VNIQIHIYTKIRLSVYVNFHIFVYMIILHVYIFGFLDRRKCNRGGSPGRSRYTSEKESVTCADGAREHGVSPGITDHSGSCDLPVVKHPVLQFKLNDVIYKYNLMEVNHAHN
jgi:hypothetical protein